MNSFKELEELYRQADSVGRMLILNTARRQARENQLRPKLSLIDCRSLRHHLPNIVNSPLQVPTLPVVSLAVDL